MTDLHITTCGTEGEHVVLVHGDVRAGEAAFDQQRPLAARWQLSLPDRRGFGASPPTAREDFEADAEDIAELLGELPGGSAHLVGHSYGGVVSLLAAARRPDAVRSLTVLEPPAFGVARGVPAVDSLVAILAALLGRAPEMTPYDSLVEFAKAVGIDSSGLPAPLPPPLEANVRLLMGCRPPWEASIPFDALNAARFPKLVISGGHSAAFDRVCDVLADGIGGQRAVFSGQGHSVPRVGEPLNEALEVFWRSASLQP